MKDLQDEIRANFSSFTSAWKSEQATVTGELDASSETFFASYMRLVSLNAWREYLLSNILSQGSLAFFFEAQNDALVSHVFARQGAWRSALQSLRACIEAVVFCLYYKDHPVELMQWKMGKHKPSCANLLEYLASNPCFLKLDANITGLAAATSEYSILSRAVHGGESFRMTVGHGGTKLWSSAAASLGAWATRESHTISALNLMLLTMFREHLDGTKLALLRKAVSLTLPTTRHTAIKQHLKVVLYKS